MSPNSEHPEHAIMSAAAATELVRKMIFEESRRAGDAENAMRSLDYTYGLGFWTLDHFRKGRAKTCDVGLYARIRAAYVDLCLRKIMTLQSEVRNQVAAGDDTLSDLSDEIALLAQKISAKKTAGSK